LAWVATRIAIVVSIYLAVMAAFGTIFSFWAILALPVAVLTGMAFGAPMAAFAATLDKDSGFSTLYRFVIIPLFLFSGIFFPISQLPLVLQVVAYISPLFHGVALCRDLTLGTVHLWPDLGHAAYLCLWVGVGYAVGRHTFAKRLVV
jgi:lipooligosaccharide transport system permease protein